MRNFWLFTLFSLCNLHVVSQITFEKTFGSFDDDEGEAIALCHDGTYILAATVENIYTGDPDIFLARLNPYGDTLWTRTFINEYISDYAYDVLQCYDLGFIITGCTYSNDTSMPFLMKYNENGQFLWLKKYGSEIPDGYAFALVQKPDSGFVICGRRDYYNTDWYHRPFLLETDKDGVCSSYGIYTVGEYDRYQVNNMCLGAENEFVMCGYYEQTLVSEIDHAWLFKVDSAMNISLSKTYGPSGYTSTMNDILLADDGGYVLCGSNHYSEIPLVRSSYNIYLIKTDSAGTAEWSKSIGHPDLTEYGSCVDKTDDGGYIVGGMSSFGTFNSDIWLLKTGESGDTSWSRRFGGIYNEGIRDICTTPDGGYLLCGYTESLGLGGSDIYLIKTNENGLLTRIDEKEDILDKIEIYPNPGNGLFFIRNCPHQADYVIYNINGRMLMKDEMVGGLEEKVDIRNFSPGIYFLILASSSGSKAVKLIKNQ